ncbi:hypothetical protein AVEN_69278-1 [Araneus ventricosus]|uniref:Uncharacterized protein n=1 Tax=Araneus ventricosus TaxID=182803 RepID=A0A4Y2VN79_ARAVE|nr:hypothetical protein AVEN_69278-1 [Araneus ventricosus]
MSRNAVSPSSVAQGRRERGGICCYIPFFLLLLILLKLDIHEASAPIHLDRFAKYGSNFQLIHIVGSFTKAPKRTIGCCDPCLLLFPPSKQDPPSPRVVFAFVREACPSSGFGTRRSK